MAPDSGEVSSIAYRNPEVYFNEPWTSAIDVWAWGIAVGDPTALSLTDALICNSIFHLLQARIDFSSPGIYDCIIRHGTLEQKANAVRGF